MHDDCYTIQAKATTLVALNINLINRTVNSNQVFIRFSSALFQMAEYHGEEYGMITMARFKSEKYFTTFLGI